MAQRVARTVVSVVSALLVFLASVANAQERGRLIRDTEIEATIAAYAAPLLSAAGLDANAVRFYIVNSPVLNAFVAGGQNLFMSTGLLVKSEDASQVIGVMSHEFGHMAGGHLARLDGALKDAFTQSIIGQLIAVAAGVLAGNAGAAAGISLGSNQMVQRSLLSFTRAQEQAADQAGLTFLDQSHQSARGLLRFLEILGDQEALVIDRQDAYVVTHPLTRDRVEFVRHHVERSPWSDAPIDPAFAEMHRRMVAKLAGFLGYPTQTLRTYPTTDQSLYGRYARAIAYYKMPDLPKALAEIDSLIAEFPRDPYFQELKAQILFENGRIAEALPFNEAAVRLSPNAPLLRVSLAHNLIELNQPQSDKRAIAHLEEALRNDGGNALGWRLAATAYGRGGNMGMSSLSLAEYSLQSGRYHEAVGQAQRAERLLPRGSPGWLRSQDILDLARREAQKRRESSRR